ncbi:MAG TPA: hypothetical protein VLA89_01375, partial [Gemmatimonadales bacterium]|nr:hypothetical protein [Gemmatimonadales bacterium]
IRLTTGEEAVFRSIEELSLGISSGVIAADAEIYHEKSRSWLPIRTHPDYQAALEQRPIALEEPDATQESSTTPPEPSSEPELATSPEGGLSAAPKRDGPSEESALKQLPPALGPALAAPVLHMESRSGRELLLRRKNPTPLMIGIGGVAAAAIVVVLFVLPRPTTPIPEAIRPPNIGGTHPDPLPLTPNPAPTTVESLAASPAEPGHKVGPQVPTPEELAARRDIARDHQIKALDQEIAKLAFTRLFTPSRLATVDSVRLTRRAIGPLRTMLTQYRSSVAQIDITYQDSAERLGASGVWPVGALTSWKARGPAGEDKDEVAQSDSLLGAIDRLFALLAEEEGQYSSDEESISFSDASAAADYDGIRNMIEHLTAFDSTATPSHAPMARLVAAANPLPPFVVWRSPGSRTHSPADTAEPH